LYGYENYAGVAVKPFMLESRPQILANPFHEQKKQA